eukprot:TRINITY_DN5569_c0_g1_i1.p1 TRINITY_DN5569_c0_g1~~TRINITY_DN5569_c0_g1_i1.p1  ORF type:complete len:1052 (+),score=271.57 TRINITY_DN5569_c0_g1_i1:49-3204(+)
MLIFVKSFVNNKKISLDVEPTTTVQEVITMVERIQPEVIVKRVLFAGQVLQVQNTLQSYNVLKECSLQLMGAKRQIAADEKKEEEPNPDDDMPPPGSPGFARQKTAPSLQFGDVLVVELVGARKLQKSDYWSNSSDPYVILNLGTQTARSSVVSKNLNPKWEETFVFHVFGDGPHKLGLLCFDHDYLSSDDQLGSAEVDLSDIERDTPIYKHIKLENVDTGELILNIRRAALTSEMLVNAVLDIAKLEKPLTDKVLKKHGLTINQIIGDEAFIIKTKAGASENPALKQLYDLVATKALIMNNERTFIKVQKILRTQKAIFSEDLPSRHLVIVNVDASSPESEQTFFEGFQEISEKNVQNVIINPGAGLAFATLQTAESSVLSLASFKQTFPDDDEWGSLRFCFSPRVTTDHLFAKAKAATFASLSGPHQTSDIKIDSNDSETLEKRHLRAEWSTHFVILTGDDTLSAYKSLQSGKPVFELKFHMWTVVETGPFSFELLNAERTVSYFFRDSAAGKLEKFRRRLQEIKSPDYKPVDLPRYKIKSGDHAESVVDELYRPALSKEFIHVNSVRNMILSLVEEGKSNEVAEMASLEDVKDLLSKQEFENYLAATLKDFLKNSAQVSQCPKCGFAFEVDYHSWSSKLSNLTKEVGIDKRPMNDEAQKHFLANRIRCRNDPCETIFCKTCKVVPYHTGFTCQEYTVFLNAPHCRYCTTTVLPGRNQYANPRSEAMHNICDSEACGKKAALACEKSKSCGHHCFGISGEEACPPCLVPKCVEESKVLMQDMTEMCCICYSEDLGSAPSVRLTSCGHWFHSQCLKERLSRKWPGARIGFKFLLCPLCSKEMEHPSVAAELAEVRKLKEIVGAKVKERVENEALHDEEKVKDEHSPYYNDPVKYGWDVYAFYQCYHCKQPYFGGRRACEANLAEEAAPSEYVCMDCSSLKSKKKCDIPEHQEFILWKCRFCCSLATWYCWGRVHFCEYCHTNDPWGRDAGNYDNEDRAKCPPPGKTECPIGGNHPPNSHNADSEFAMGCGMCSNDLQDKAKKLLADQGVQ